MEKASTPPKTDFKMIPEKQGLDQIPRDLRFHPVVNDSPRCFTQPDR